MTGAAWSATLTDEDELHLQVRSVLRAPDRLKFPAGSGVSSWVNDVAPGAIALRLPEVAP